MCVCMCVRSERETWREGWGRVGGRVLPKFKGRSKKVLPVARQGQVLEKPVRSDILLGYFS